jgi:hypothetical protein
VAAERDSVGGGPERVCLHIRVDPRIFDLDALAPGAAHDHLGRWSAVFDVWAFGHVHLDPSPYDGVTASGRGGRYLKMLTERAATRRTLSAETLDSESISIFARRVSGIASVGLNAIEFVNET